MKRCDAGSVRSGNLVHFGAQIRDMWLNKGEIELPCATDNPIHNRLHWAPPGFFGRLPGSLVTRFNSLNVDWVCLCPGLQLVDDRVNVRDENFVMVHIGGVAE